MIRLDVRADVRKAEKFLSNLKRNAVRKAASRAINDALITLRAEGAREIKASHPAMKIGDIKGEIEMTRSTPATLTGSVDTKGRPLSALMFKVRGGQKTRKGRRPTTAMFGRTRKQVQYQGRKGFQVLRYGNEVFVRRNAKGRQIRRYRGPSMPGVFRAQKPFFERRAAQRWATTFPNRLKYEIEQAKA